MTEKRPTQPVLNNEEELSLGHKIVIKEIKVADVDKRTPFRIEDYFYKDQPIPLRLLKEIRSLIEELETNHNYRLTDTITVWAVYKAIESIHDNERPTNKSFLEKLQQKIEWLLEGYTNAEVTNFYQLLQTAKPGDVIYLEYGDLSYRGVRLIKKPVEVIEINTEIGSIAVNLPGVGNMEFNIANFSAL